MTNKNDGNYSGLSKKNGNEFIYFFFVHACVPTIYLLIGYFFVFYKNRNEASIEFNHKQKPYLSIFLLRKINLHVNKFIGMQVCM